MIKKILFVFIFLCGIETFAQDTAPPYDRWRVSSFADFEGVIGGRRCSRCIGQDIKYTDRYIEFNQEKYYIKRMIIEFWTEEDLYKETRGTGSRGLTFKDLNTDYKYVKTIWYKTDSISTTGTFLIITGDKIALTMCRGAYCWIRAH